MYNNNTFDSDKTTMDCKQLFTSYEQYRITEALEQESGAELFIKLVVTQLEKLIYHGHANEIREFINTFYEVLDLCEPDDLSASN